MKKNRIIVTVTAGVVSISLTTAAFISPLAAATKLTDIANYQWKNSIEFLESRGVISGNPDGTYQPDNAINRAEFTKIIVESSFDFANESDLDAFAEDCFPDVKKSDWFAKYICFAKKENIIGGYPDGKFKPAKSIIQAEALKIILETFLQDIPASGSEWYQRYFDQSEFIGMFYFNPASAPVHETTRGEMAYFTSWMLDENGSDQIAITEFANKYDDKENENSDFRPMTADECLEGEVYDDQMKVCYIECDTDKECEAIEAKIATQAGEIYDAGSDLSRENEKYNPEETQSYIVYTISGDAIKLKEKKVDEQDPNVKILNADDKHLRIWNRFISIIPSQYREKYIAEFQIFSDGEAGTMAAVFGSETDPSKWVLAVDIVDAFPDGENMDTNGLISSLIHEYAHILTLNESQLNATETTVENEKEFAAAEAACLPQYFNEDGCLKANSYLNLFQKSFWGKIMSEWKKLRTDYQADSEDQYAAFNSFFQKYQTSFVTDYAPTSPEEDIAESFTAFVLKDKILNELEVRDKKINFFYNFPELIMLRKTIRERL